MKRNLGYSMREAEREFFDACDGTHVIHLIEVFARPRPDMAGDWDVSRPDPRGEAEAIGELWLADEDGYDDIVNNGWDYEGRECVGFDRDELASQHFAPGEDTGMKERER